MNRFPLGPLSDLERLVEERVTPLFAGFTTEQMALLSTAAGIGEETLFRGLLQGGVAHAVESPYRIGIALAVSSIAFGLCHYLSKTYFVLTTLIGLYLGWLYLWTGNLMAPIVTHAVYDFVALVYLVRWKRS
jgi:membrane protease YdiL (CAAX protease family)